MTFRDPKDVDDYQKRLQDVISEMNLPEDVKEELRKTMSEGMDKIVGEEEFLRRITMMFDEKYKSPGKSLQAMHHLLFFNIYLMLKTAEEDLKQGSSSPLYLLSLLTPLATMIQELGKGYNIIGNLVASAITKFAIENRDVMVEAKERHVKNKQDNERWRREYEAKGGGGG
ncbi:MAG TPA: hypothetical protein VGE97_07830 [Nitrososphaera sp.]